MLQLALKLGFDLNRRQSSLRGTMKNCKELTVETELAFVWRGKKSMVVDIKLIIIICFKKNY